MLLHDCWGDGSDHHCWKVRYMNTGRSRQALYFCRRARVLKKRVQRSKDPPYLSLTQVMGLSPSHRSGQGAHSSRLANLKQIVTRRRGKGVGGCRRKAFQQKPEQNGVTKNSFDRKDIMLLSTIPPFHFFIKCSFLQTLWAWFGSRVLLCPSGVYWLGGEGGPSCFVRAVSFNL